MRGFSLVELSIVLVILGLLTGGILAGQSLIRASELRAVTAEYQRYLSATNTFRDKYFALPGDMRNAESFWQQLDPTPATCQTTVSTNALTCNGDGDGNVEVFGGSAMEIFRFWQHMANAGLVEGSYTGTRAGGGNWDVTPGTNIPRSKITRAGWVVFTRVDVAIHGGFYTNMFQPKTNHWFSFSVGATQPVIKPEEAWNIDTKLDDGLPGQGLVTTFDTTANPNCATTAVATTATYALTQTGNTCAMLMGF